MAPELNIRGYPGHEHRWPSGRPGVHVVSERLGHSKVSMTMEVYAHVLPDMQMQAVATMGALLHG
jgi:integrase